MTSFGNCFSVLLIQIVIVVVGLKVVTRYFLSLGLTGGLFTIGLVPRGSISGSSSESVLDPWYAWVVLPSQAIITSSGIFVVVRVFGLPKTVHCLSTWRFCALRLARPFEVVSSCCSSALVRSVNAS